MHELNTSNPTQAQRATLLQSISALAAFGLVLGGCQPEDPYQDTQNPPTSREQQAATAAVEPGVGEAATDGVSGASSQLPLDQRAAGSETAWNDATRADYEKAIEDCKQMGEATRADCIEQVRIGFRAAQMDLRNPDELRQHPLPDTDGTSEASVDADGAAQAGNGRDDD